MDEIDPRVQEVASALRKHLRVHHLIKMHKGNHYLYGTYLTFNNAKKECDRLNQELIGNEYASSSLSYYVKTVVIGRSNDMLQFYKPHVELT